MKPRLSTNHETGLTLFEVGLVVAIVVMLVALVLPLIAIAKRKTSRVGCNNNLKQIDLAYRIWAGDNRDLYPMAISVTNGGSMEMAQTGNVAVTFQVMSNELSSARILICTGDGSNPGDTTRTFATNFSSLSNSNISYLVGVDVTNDVNPQMILSGDCNFEIGVVPVKSGLLSLWTNDPVAWSAARHVHSGNLGLADGSVQSATQSGLRRHLVDTSIATNRLAIP